IKTNIFDFETPISKAFNEFNYLLKIDTDLLTSDIRGFKTRDEFKDEWMGEWNKGIPWVLEEPWSENGISIDDIHHICEPFCFKNGKAKWPTCNSNDDEFYGSLKDEALKKKSHLRRVMGRCNSRSDEFLRIVEKMLRKFHELDYELLVKLEEYWNDVAAIQEEREPNDDHGIDNLDYDLVRDNTSYHTNKEEEQSLLQKKP
ncbi:hypothetical protein Tco_0461828, partial [Tanacetum coccineum]